MSGIDNNRWIPIEMLDAPEPRSKGFSSDVLEREIWSDMDRRETGEATRRSADHKLDITQIMKAEEISEAVRAEAKAKEAEAKQAPETNALPRQKKRKPAEQMKPEGKPEKPAPKAEKPVKPASQAKPEKPAQSAKPAAKAEKPVKHAQPTKPEKPEKPVQSVKPAAKAEKPVKQAQPMKPEKPEKPAQSVKPAPKAEKPEKPARPEPLLQLWLVRINPRFKETIQIKEDSATLGKSMRADHTIRGNRSISRIHARVYRQGEDFYVEDCGSLNNTYVDERMVTRPCRLLEGSVLRLADEDFAVRII